MINQSIKMLENFKIVIYSSLTLFPFLSLSLRNIYLYLFLSYKESILITFSVLAFKSIVFLHLR